MISVISVRIRSDFIPSYLTSSPDSFSTSALHAPVAPRPTATLSHAPRRLSACPTAPAVWHHRRGRPRASWSHVRPTSSLDARRAHLIGTATWSMLCRLRPPFLLLPSRPFCSSSRNGNMAAKHPPPIHAGPAHALTGARCN